MRCLLLLLFFAFGVSFSSAQDETSEDAFAMSENEGMEGFAMSTEILEPIPVTTKATITEEHTHSIADEGMSEDPFEMETKGTSTMTAKTLEETTTVVPIEEEEKTTTNGRQETTEEMKEEEEETIEKTKEEENVDEKEISEPSTATIWTASTEAARETTERRVLKEKSGEVKEESTVEETTKESPVMIEEEEATTMKTEKEGESEEAPFDSHQLSGLFEADGSPKAEEGPAFPILQMPDEHSAEILGNEDARPKTTTTEGTTMTTTMEMTEAATTEITERSTEETTTEGTTTTEETTKTTTSEMKTMVEEATTTTMKALMREEPMKRPQTHSMVSTPVTVKITSIEWMNDFANNTSGKYKKLTEQILPEMSQLMSELFGDQFVSFEVESLSKGSVVVNGLVHTKGAISDAEQTASRFETLLTAAGNHLGGNSVDPASVTVNGVPSRAYLDRVNASYTPASSSPLLISVVIAVGVVLFLIIIVSICLVTNRKAHGGAKLAMKMPEDGGGRMNGVPQINLMSYAGTNVGSPNSRSTTMPRHEEREVV